MAISASGFFWMTGTYASSAGNPVTRKRNGFSSAGRSRMVFRNPIGLGVCVNETKLALCSATIKRPVAIPTD